jgi:hypothetical protein
MYAQKLETLPPPPGVIGSLKAGFDAVSSHVLLILLPLTLDLFLWLGPRLNVSQVFGPVYAIMFDQARRGLTSPNDVQRFASFQKIFDEGLQRFNLVSLVSKLQTFPIGISSLLARTMPLDSPVRQNMVQITSPIAVLGCMFLLAGVVYGNDGYFHTVAVGAYDVDVHQSSSGEWSVVHLCDAVVLGDRAFVLCSSWNLCARAECLPFNPGEFQNGTLHTANKRHVCL